LLLDSGVKFSNDDLDRILSEVSASGHIPILSLLIDAGASVNPATPGLVPALYGALAAGQEDAVDFLLEAGADTRPEDFAMAMLLEPAAEGGCLRLVRQLLEEGGLADMDMRQALSYGAMKGHTEIVAALLAAGVDVDVSIFDNETPLMEALQNGHAATAQVLLEAGADISRVNDYGRSVLMHAVWGCCTDIVTFLLANGVSPLSEDGNSALAYASDPAIVALLLAQSGVVTSKWSVFHASCSKSRLASVKMLVAAGADVHQLAYTRDHALTVAIRGDPFAEGGDAKADIVRVLLDAGARVRYEGAEISALHACARQRHDPEDMPAVAALLLAHDPEALDARNEKGDTALLDAVQRCHLPMVEFLLAEGADANLAGTDGGRTPLMTAFASNGLPPLHLVDTLLRAGAAVGLRDDAGRTALFHAVLGNRRHARRRRLRPHLCSLLAAGADPYAVDGEGQTVLMAAVADARCVEDAVAGFLEVLVPAMR
jgi:ankyrin repeat protein